MKERIIGAFMDLSSTMGFYNVTMDELASRAGMSKRTIYRYFRSKEEIIEAVLDEFMSKVAGGIGQIIAKENKPADIIAGIVLYITQTAPTFINPLVLNDLKVHYPELWQKVNVLFRFTDLFLAVVGKANLIFGITGLCISCRYAYRTVIPH